MKIEIGDYATVITLSRRNLKTLLLKLDEPDSFKSIFRDTAEGGRFYIKAEDDEVHYEDRTPGIMHPREEERL